MKLSTGARQQGLSYKTAWGASFLHGFQVVEAVQETGSSRRLIGKSLLPGPGAQFHDLYHHIHIRTCLAIFVGSRW